jgi:hypothetical protein
VPTDLKQHSLTNTVTVWCWLSVQEGSLVELLALVPLEGLSLSLKPLRLAGLAGWDSLGASAAREWLGDIARTQVGGRASLVR